MRAKRPILLTAAIALLTSVGTVPVISAQDAAAQPAAAQKNYKDRGEYDLFLKVTQTTDPKARLDVLNTWQEKYPQTDYSAERSQYFLATLGQLAATDPSQRQKLIDKASEALKADPKNFRAAYLIALWGPAVGGENPPPELLSQVDSAAHATIDGANDAFDPSKKPANIAQADFDKAKGQATAIAHNALAWQATSKKDLATVESEYKASLQANPEQAGISATFAKLLIGEKKYPEGLFEYARAAQYEGSGALPAPAKTQLMDYFNKAYVQFHGSDEGKQAFMDQAKATAVPPDNMQLSSQADTAQKSADATNARMASDPAFKLWYSIKVSLAADSGPGFFSSNMKDVEVPGGAQGVNNFQGTVITADANRVTLGVEDAAKPDAALEFSQPLPAAAMDKIKVGEKLEFGGVADSFTKEPYMLTFKDPTIPGVQTAAPAKKGRRR